ncbi:putative membrane protein [Halobacteriovorax marinus SJ]|uniref:Membrane protein n=1 Tax=Halobacteriovorax marinus (strain ATCC BAA-682 / DSM 15412 / SJ) TaxID=862908 RepID=E1WZP2_HALMS|nr:DUF2914 domain-containing protein [Halobacteriovorax marinus]CBW26228.1 putative membrane protein [Halobacteriovorax marinus SJ]
MNFITKSKEIHQKYPNLLVAIFFSGGFLFDIFTLGQVDELANFFGHTIYIILLITSFLHLERKYDYQWLNKFALYQKDIFHFFAGSLLSGFAIFFFKSSSLSVSGLFILLILALLMANESPKLQSTGPVIKLILLQFCLSAFFIIYIPVIVGLMGVTIFLITLVLSAITLPIILTRLKHQAVLESKIIAVAMSFILLMGYITNLIPPVPLSVKKIGVYHNIEKSEGVYKLYKEKSFLDYFGLEGHSFKYKEGDKVFVFARIFAPKGFKENLYIQWEKWDKTWKISDKIPLSIKGGNLWGYRAFTYKKNYSDGLWRARVMSSDKREVARVEFSISPSKIQEREWNIITEE